MSLFPPSGQQIAEQDGRPTHVMAFWMQAVTTVINVLGGGSGGSGGTGFTNHAVLLGRGTSPFGTTGPGTAGQVLTSNGASADPTFQAAGAGTVTHTGALTAGQLLIGNGSADITVGNLSGDVTTTGSTATTIANDAVTFVKMQNIATQTLLGRDTAGTGDPEAVGISTALDWLT